MKKKRNKIILLVVALLIVIIIGFCVSRLLSKNTDGLETIKILDNIKEYGYTLDERDTDLMKKTYNELKEILHEKEVDYTKYASTLAKLFVIDLFTMNNKINKYDVGSFEYVYPDSVNSFKMDVEDTIYKHLENNSKGKRNQELPVVKSVEVESIDEDTYELDGEVHESYIVNLTWQYSHDLGYDKEATITLIKVDNKLYVVEYKTGE